MKPQVNPINKKIASMIAMQTINDMKPEIEHIAVATICQAMCITLHDKYDWSPNQLNELLLKIADQFDSVKKNYLTMEDIAAWCEGVGITQML